MFAISGKVALITGGAQGIGLATVKELLQNGLKAISILDINEELGQNVVKDIQHEFGEGKAIFLKVDVANRNQFEDAFKIVIDTFQNLDIVINNAGIVNEIEWERTVGVNLVSTYPPFVLVQAVRQNEWPIRIGTTNGTLLAFEHYLPKYKSAEEGVILNISSTGAFIFSPHIPAYSATKYGILGLTCTMGQPSHYERRNVRVMAIAPNSTSTRMFPCDLSKLLNDEYREIPKKLNYSAYHHIFQKAESVAKGIVKVIMEGKNGSVWIIEDDEPPHETTLPRYEQIKEKMNPFSSE